MRRKLGAGPDSPNPRKPRLADLTGGDWDAACYVGVQLAGDAIVRAER